MEDKLPERKKIRLKNYDYSNTGIYFITVCIKQRIMNDGNGFVGAMSSMPRIMAILRNKNIKSNGKQRNLNYVR